MSANSLRTEADRPKPKKKFKRPVFLQASTRGWPFVLAWLHRISGILLVILSCVIVYSQAGGLFTGQMAANTETMRSKAFISLFLISLVPVLFHASNGGRLILYELFGCRKEGTLLRWMFGLSLLYLGFLVLIMFMGDQTVSLFFFWLMTVILASLLGNGAAAKLRKTQHSKFWKWQRISGAFLLGMIPAHPVYLFLNPAPLAEMEIMVPSFQGYFAKVVHLLVLLGVIYHGGYGLLSVGWDYLSARFLKKGLTVLVMMVMGVFLWLGIKAIF